MTHMAFPGISLAKDGVRQAGGEVANGRVLDGGRLLSQIVRALVYRNMLLGFLCLLENFLSNLELSSSGEPEATKKSLKSKTMRCTIQLKTHSGVSTYDGEVVVQGSEKLECSTLVCVTTE
jgi:hypothetical protein